MTAPERLDDAEWEMLADWQAPGVRLARTVERIVAQHAARAVAEALREAADECMAKSAELRAAYREHNAGRDPSRPRIRPDLDTWAAAEEAVGNRLRARAEGQS